MAKEKLKKVIKGLQKASKTHAKQAKTLQSLKMKKGGKASKKPKSKGKICPEGKAWAKRTFDVYPSAYANLAASKYCKDPNYAKKAKGGKRKGKFAGGPIRGQGAVMSDRLR
jgi:hypothetical protein|tara:strand:- start:532 stop:867 length:336 start_codon:yes stop_codon:yes gene_type:complete